MRSKRCGLGVLTGTLAVGVAGCGAPSTPTSNTTPTAVATATATPAPPDTDTVTVVTTGVGTWQLVTIPVALLHNDATRHGAEEVVVHFSTRSAAGRALGSLDSAAVNLAPGETLPVAADCTDACNSAASVSVTVTVGLWTAMTGASFTATGVAYRCGTGACGGGHGQGDVTGTLTTSRLRQGAALVAFAACTGSGGAIVGGGLLQTQWQGGSNGTVEVPVIVNRAPAACRIGASTGW